MAAVLRSPDSVLWLLAVAVSCGMASGQSGAELISTSARQCWTESKEILNHMYSRDGLTYCGKCMPFCMFGPGEQLHIATDIDIRGIIWSKQTLMLTLTDKT